LNPLTFGDRTVMFIDYKKWKCKIKRKDLNQKKKESERPYNLSAG
jgi:hypothetical protein